MDMNGIVGLGGCGIIHNGEVSLYSIFYFSIFFFFSKMMFSIWDNHAEDDRGMFILVSLFS